MPDYEGPSRRWRGRIAAAIAAAVAAAALVAAFLAAITLFAPTRAGEPDRGTAAPLCCGVPPADEVTADQVFGRWIVMHAGIGAPVRAGERVEFRRDGTLAVEDRVCRFAILRAELSITCEGAEPNAAGPARPEARGDVRFVDDTKLLWRLDNRSTVYIAPVD